MKKAIMISLTVAVTAAAAVAGYLSFAHPQRYVGKHLK